MIETGFTSENELILNLNQPKIVQYYDFDRDGEEEAIVHFEIKKETQPSPSIYGVRGYKKVGQKWKQIWEKKIEGVGVTESILIDINGDGVKEYLFGVPIGASAGNQLFVFQWNDGQLHEIAKFMYHKLETIKEEGKVGLALWQRYIADAYLVDVLAWNGQELIVEPSLFQAYFPIIDEFYERKIAQMDTWFYRYCLADAQIKAGHDQGALLSIQRGIELAKEAKVSDGIQLFYDLKEKIK